MSIPGCRRVGDFHDAGDDHDVLDDCDIHTVCYFAVSSRDVYDVHAVLDLYKCKYACSSGSG
jgi:hypothetical protein